MKLTGKKAFITGGARGIGRGLAEAVLEEGGKVVIVDRLQPVGEATAEELNQKYGHGSAFFIQCDVTSRTQLEDVFQKAIGELGWIDIVVNNAGIVTGENLNFELVVNVNLTAVIHGNVLALEHMRKDKGGRGGAVVNMASIAGVEPFSLDPVYSATKHGVVGLSRSLAEHSGPLGLIISCLCPVAVRTDMCPDASVILPEWMERGYMEVADIVKAFKTIVEDEKPGGVAVVSGKGFHYMYPTEVKESD